MKLMFAIVAALALAGCKAERPAPASALIVSQACIADPVQRHVGQVATPALLEQVRAESNSAVARRLTPGMIVTMEFRADRVDVSVGADGKVERINCG